MFPCANRCLILLRLVPHCLGFHCNPFYRQYVTSQLIFNKNVRGSGTLDQPVDQLTDMFTATSIYRLPSKLMCPQRKSWIRPCSDTHQIPASGRVCFYVIHTHITSKATPTATCLTGVTTLLYSLSQRQNARYR